MNKTVIVTGGATGIGRAVSSLLCREGYNTVVAYNNSEEAAFSLVDELLSERLSAVAFKCDVSDSMQVNELIDHAIQEFGKIDGIVNNAGIAQQKLLSDIADEDWSKMISVNLSGCFNCCRAASLPMVRQHFGVIINISSMWGIVGASCESHYSASKAGMIGLTKSLAKELGPSNIRVNCVAPGVIKTDMLSAFSEADLNILACDTPLERIGTPEDVANAVSFLLSEKASFITGQTICVDGGFSL